ncbi:hypothetical protein M409DRAFT_23473 [Zasmidium cellare ATCC 36951]|uniref:RING-type E3 ubiquitin transferase n=1 Tax=Zasmidium cellare ATCC 36951 TaxID=1080233 RepID=A0A6A6CK11_ZASCE|nr:uncharacterized protein M409DRAFT_23473 [Zasmidium cellare ATCC 36951]KAF2166282.1 hypothetical protein M409DRAFT_23473 [Zasmidium cellare ATCC 36951]
MDGQPDDFKIKGAAAIKRTHTPETCTICLEPITERAVAAPCNHLTFDFICLVSWLQEQSTCPLCKTQVSEVQYDWRSPDDYKTYHVPTREEGEKKREAPTGRRRPRRHPQPPPPAIEDPSLTLRREIYTHRLYALHIGSNAHSNYHSFTPADVRSSPTLQSRAKTFLRRELRVFPFLTPSRVDFLIEYILAILRNFELRGADGKAEELVGEFVGRENARQVVHELEAWLRSPFGRLGGWDERVQYKDRCGDRGKGEGGLRGGRDECNRHDVYAPMMSR